MDNSYLSRLWKVKNFFKNIANNIAFIPALLGVAGFFLGLIMSLLESFGITPFLIEKAPFLIINNYETASTILSYLSAGIISIMVFSFSMVMLLLNQASSNFSPRVLPGLISVRKHQYILGMYFGTLLYNTFVMIGIKPSTDKYQLPGFSILFGIILTIICLFLFISFIDSISKSIQVESILNTIFQKSQKRLEDIIKGQKAANDFPNSDDWARYPSTKFGYLRGFNEQGLIEFCKRYKLHLEVIQYQGAFTGSGMELFKSSQTLSKDQLEELSEFMMINRTPENVLNNYVLGFKQIAEIGVRAMSPGVNDPGTAVNTIDYLTELFAIRLKLADRYFIYNDDEQPSVQVKAVSFEELISQVLMGYRTYCKSDMSCSQKLILMLKSLKENPYSNSGHKKILDFELEKLMKDVESSIHNSEDMEILRELKASF